MGLRRGECTGLPVRDRMLQGTARGQFITGKIDDLFSRQIAFVTPLLFKHAISSRRLPFVRLEALLRV